VTGAEFGGVDIDLLADYVGGALDGTPDEAVVAALIMDDPAWREAHAQLSGGVVTVTGQLRGWGAEAEPMPADVLARLDAALLAESRDASIASPSPGATAGPAAREPGTDGAAPVRRLVAVPSGSGGGRARRLRWAAPIGIAAAVLAFVGFGWQQQFAGGGSEDTATNAGSAAEQPAPLAAAGEEFSGPGGSVPLSQSGTDYSPETLMQAARKRVAAGQPELEAPTDASRDSASDGGEDRATSEGLDRLRVQAALRACIDAIAAQHGAGEITPQVIDFARFRGAPALIVEFTIADGGSWVWASGPACGTPGVGADKLASVKVG
jgi:hypothetical protein